MEKYTKYFIIQAAIGIFLVISIQAANADIATVTATMQAAVSDVFSIEFYTDANVLYSTNIPFTNIDPTKSLCYADSRREYDGKSDTGVVCKSNLNVTWYLKMGATTSTPTFPMANFKYYMGQPWNRNTGQQADGTLAQTPNWYSIPTAPTVVYTSGDLDKSNLPYGALATLSFAIDPRNLYSGVSYIINISYTLATAP